MLTIYALNMHKYAAQVAMEKCSQKIDCACTQAAKSNTAKRLATELARTRGGARDTSTCLAMAQVRVNAAFVDPDEPQKMDE